MKQHKVAANQSVLVGLISNLVTCVQLNVAMLTVHLNCQTQFQKQTELLLSFFFLSLLWHIASNKAK